MAIARPLSSAETRLSRFPTGRRFEPWRNYFRDSVAQRLSFRKYCIHSTQTANNPRTMHHLGQDVCHRMRQSLVSASEVSGVEQLHLTNENSWIHGLKLLG
jgi:hypothetical protein